MKRNMKRWVTKDIAKLLRPTGAKISVRGSGGSYDSEVIELETRNDCVDVRGFRTDCEEVKDGSDCEVNMLEVVGEGRLYDKTCSILRKAGFDEIVDDMEDYVA